MKQKNVGRPKEKVTAEELIEIKRNNKEKLDWILEQGEDYLIERAKDLYGASWMCIFAGENHYLHKIRMQNNAKNLRDSNYIPAKGNRMRRIQKLDMKTLEVLHTYQNAEDARRGEELSDVQIGSLLACCTKRYPHYKGFKWKFEDEEQILNQLKQIDNEQE